MQVQPFGTVDGWPSSWRPRQLVLEPFFCSKVLKWLLKVAELRRRMVCRSLRRQRRQLLSEVVDAHWSIILIVKLRFFLFYLILYVLVIKELSMRIAAIRLGVQARLLEVRNEHFPSLDGVEEVVLM